MSDLIVMLRLFLGVFFILANGFFVAIEFALTRVRQYPRSEFDVPGLRRAWEMTERLEIYLTSCQVGITASSIALGMVTEPALVAVLEPFVGALGRSSHFVAAGLGFVAINLLHLTHGEQTPTYLGVERTKQVVTYGAPVLYWWTKLIIPFIVVGDTVAKATLRLFGVRLTRSWTEEGAAEITSRSDLHQEMVDILGQGDLSAEREGEVLRALTIGEEPVRQIMVERGEIVTLSTVESPATNRSVIEEYQYARYPLVGESIDDFRGVVYLPALVNQFDSYQAGELSLEEIASKPLTIEADTPISAAIDRFQAENQELALVTDDGAVVGLVTVTDAFEAVLGDIEDPMDRRGRADRR